MWAARVYSPRQKGVVLLELSHNLSFSLALRVRPFGSSFLMVVVLEWRDTCT